MWTNLWPNLWPEHGYRLAAFTLGLFLTLVLAAWLTPRAWWKRPNVRALLILAGGTWGIGSLVAALLPAAPPAIPAPALAPAAVNTAPPLPVLPLPERGVAYHAHRDINLRAGAGTNSPRLAIVPRGTEVIPTGRRNGDWWQVRAGTGSAGGGTLGWASSLWLRRGDEEALKSK
ncbi:SH3 domain-containing protein [Janthinobacterium agaricidamnosum]|uniref:Bacterial SH3 domain protein n=1 Tax=Janthinobacterium agaricidamnosum NBRC 102515 = DSM 9628 TaxID=1349767 RepID=W0V1F6_9BURK|nr:SH3 domain-containing protein [Janthinobacterium agaricidamnosum]CDG82659.1 bacterial SH3 domain protein [Janthinobacterium agaricidamnosum NBRC 102515 = DSM 9628]